MAGKGNNRPGGFKALIKAIRNARWLAVLLGIIILGLVFSNLSPAFLKFKNLQNISVQAAVTGVMAVGMTFVIMTAGIDISVGANLFLTLAMVAWVALNGPDPYGSFASYPLALFLGAFFGLGNGLIINYLGINPLVTTLATLTAYRGMAIHITEARIMTVPQEVRFLGVGKLGPVPIPIILALLVVVAGALVLHYTRFGRYVLAIGSSQQSARETGLPVRKVLIGVYAIAGATSGIGAMILLGRVGAVQSDLGIGIEFTVITAVVLGGTYLSGGRGSMIGSLMGAILLVMTNNGLNLIGASPFIYDIVRGGVLIGAVSLDRAATADLMSEWLPAFRRLVSSEN
ncbi:MAG: ABC transporter permease [Anaerolineales bacterium]